MTTKSDIPGNFWRELKRRRVVHMITVYAAVAFVILQLVDMVSQPLHFPDWTQGFIIVLLCVGFIISIFLSWVYDITPSGVKKTKPVTVVRQNNLTGQTSPTGWKAATFISVLVIIALTTFNFINKGRENADLSKLKKSIAVLPFINDSPGDSNQYFINGVMEEVLINLQKIKEFSVRSRTSTAQYTGADRPTIPEIANKLDVNYLVEGSGQKYGSKFVLRVQLITGENERHLWGKSYDREIQKTTDIIGLQGEIAQAIATELKATITPGEKQLIEKPSTADLTAYSLYQKGRNEHLKYWRDNKKINALDSANMFYRLALKSDSTFAQAYLGLASARANYYWRDVYTKWAFSESGMKLVRDSVLSLVDKALKYNKNLEEAYLLRGWASENKDLAIKEFGKALEINPNYGPAYNAISDVYFEFKKESIEGIKYKLKAIELEKGPDLAKLLADLGSWYEVLGFNENAINVYNQILPLTNDTLQYFQSMSGPYYARRNWEESIRWAKKILERDPNHIWAHRQLTEIYFYLGKDDSASYHIERYLGLNDKIFDNIFIINYKGYILWKHGDKKQAIAIIEPGIDYLLDYVKTDFSTDYEILWLTQSLLLKGDRERALEYLKKINYTKFINGWFIEEMEVNPIFQIIKSDERFRKILNTMKSNWQKEHEKVRIWLEENNLLEV